MNRIRVLITPGSNLPYEEAKKAIDALQSAGIVKIGLLAPDEVLR